MTYEQEGGEKSAADQIAELEAEGKYIEAGQAKLGAFVDAQSQGPTISPEVAAQIEQLESEGKWAESINLKLRATGLSYLIPGQ